MKLRPWTGWVQLLTPKGGNEAGGSCNHRAPGGYGKALPALIVQSDLFNEHPSVMILPVTSELRETPLFRIRVEPMPANGLQKISEVMVDKAQSVPPERIGDVFGHLGEDEMLAVSRSLAVFLSVV